MSTATEDALPDIGDDDLPLPELTAAELERELEDLITNVDKALVAEPVKSTDPDLVDPVFDPGGDGDDKGLRRRSQDLQDLVDSGHGFLVRDIPTRKESAYRLTCEICDGPLPRPGDDPDWLCEYDDSLQTPASLTCNCPWCLHYQDYLAGTFKPRGGRPRKRCGSKKCEAASKRQRRRAADQTKETEPEQPYRRPWRDGYQPKALRHWSAGMGGRW